jgi:hypothetical protein
MDNNINTDNKDINAGNDAPTEQGHLGEALSVQETDIADLHSTINKALTEIRLLRHGMEKDQVEIDRLKADTRLLLNKILAA